MLRTAAVCFIDCTGLPPCGTDGNQMKQTVPRLPLLILAFGGSALALLVSWALSSQTRSEVATLFMLIRTGLGRRRSR